MPKRRSTAVVPTLGAAAPAGQLGRQLAQSLRNSIAKGELKPGERLPSTRTLAASLGIARGTVTEAFEQLAAEGFLDAKIGAGTRVAPDLKEMWEATPSALAGEAIATDIRLSPAAQRLAAVVQTLAPQPAMPFAIAAPTSGIAPDDNWRRLGNRVRASGRAAPSGYADPYGLPELRAAIAEHVRRARAVHCESENVIITSGTQQGLYMAGRVLLSPGDTAWVEEPAYPGLTAVLDDLAINSHRVAVDGQGLCVEEGIMSCPAARAAFVTPSHQYPLGMPLSMARRQALIRWATVDQSWIIEDDYDSELRYAGHPFPAMQGLSPSRVIYLGTFSKVLFPSLRLGYLIAPAPLIDAFAGARAILDRHSPSAEQHVLAAYMREGYFEAHVRRIRGLYAERRASLLAALEPILPEGCAIQPSDQGMHVLLWLPEGADDQAISARAMEAGLAVKPIFRMYGYPNGRPGLMLGFGGFDKEDLVVAASKLVSLLRSDFSASRHIRR
jgi:GntR family transcriptional regulator / MocR family aminotransferase